MKITINIPDNYGGILLYLSIMEKMSVNDYAAALCVKHCKKADIKKKVSFSQEEISLLALTALQKGYDISAALRPVPPPTPAPVPPPVKTPPIPDRTETERRFGLID